MGIRLPEMVSHAKHILQRRPLLSKRHLPPSLCSQNASSTSSDHHHHNNQVPKGHFAIYVGGEEDDKKKRFVVPISYLKHPLFQYLLSKAAEEFGFDHQMGGITLPCDEQDFIHLTSHLK